MNKTTIITLKEIELTDPIIIEGLPGVGHVGKLVADHLIEELNAEKIMEIYSPSFPPQVLVEKDSLVRLVRNEVYAYKSKNIDLLIIAGDHQSTTTEGHYEICNIFLDMAEKYNVKRIYTLGGYGIGKLVETETAICLMGLTSGYMVDPKSAQAVLRILCKALKLDVDMAALEERAREIEKIVAKLQEMEQGVTPATSDDDLRYIG